MSDALVATKLQLYKCPNCVSIHLRMESDGVVIEAPLDADQMRDIVAVLVPAIFDEMDAHWKGQLN